MNLKDLQASLFLQNATDETLRALNKMIVAEFNRRQNGKVQQAKAKFRIGESVTFRDKHGRQLVGKVFKICQKNVQVMVGPTKWTCSPNLITPMKDVPIKVESFSKQGSN